jgi:D-alanine-D-alanine ligase
MIDAFRSIDAYVELFEGELPFLAALADGRLEQLGRDLQVAYNGIGFGITTGGFEPGRMALVPSVCDAYGVLATNSDAYTCAIALHRFHSFVLLRAFGVAAPPVWHYRIGPGWMGERPPTGTKVIVKSTYEAWSVGVKDSSVFVVDNSCEQRIAAIAEEIGQPVTLQAFVSGVEVCLPILALPEPVLAPAVEQVLVGKAGDRDAIMTLDDNLTPGSYVYQPFDGAPETLHAMRRTALQVFDILQQRALGRMDFRIGADGRPWLTDAAVTPGLSRASSTFASLSQLGFDHASFLRTVVAASVAATGRLTIAR